MPLTEVEKQLRLRARDLIQQGDLPGVGPARMWGGNGGGDKCSLCGETIPPDQVEYEVDSGTRTYRFHFLCHAGGSSNAHASSTRISNSEADRS